jgi:hypothetical protein
MTPTFSWKQERLCPGRNPFFWKRLEKMSAYGFVRLEMGVLNVVVIGDPCPVNLLGVVIFRGKEKDGDKIVFRITLFQLNRA